MTMREQTKAWSAKTLEKLADRGLDRLGDLHRDALTFTKFPGHHERQWAP